MRECRPHRRVDLRVAGWSAIDLLLATIAGAILMATATVVAVQHRRATRIADTVAIVNTLRAQALMGAVLYSEVDATGADRRFDASDFQGGAMPPWLMENATTYRNPIGVGEFQGYSVMTSGGEQQFAFWFWNLPRWACADLAAGLAPSGFVVRGSVLNRGANGQRVPVSVSALAAQCRSNESSTVPSLLLFGPAPN